jgi:hypothetical protein
MVFYLLMTNLPPIFFITEIPDAAQGTASFDESEESDVSQEAGCARGQGGKKDERWTLKFDLSGSEQELLDRVKQILQDLQDELGISHHPYKRQKRSSPAKIDLGDFWHVKNGRKFGATLACPFAFNFARTTQCQFKIKYHIKNGRLQLWTLTSHDHSKEIRMRGLSIDNASKVSDALIHTPTSELHSQKVDSIPGFQYPLIFHSADVKPRSIHVEINSSGDVHISPTKKKVQALRHLVRRTRKAKMEAAMGSKNAGTFHGFESIFVPLLPGVVVQQHNQDGEHLTMDTVFCLGVHVSEEDNIYVAVISTPSLLLNPLCAMQHGISLELYGDVTHKVSHHLVNIAQMAVNDVLGRGHLWG